MANPRQSPARMPGAYAPNRVRTSGDISTFAPPNIKLVGPQAEELETLIRYYDGMLEARDNQLMMLNSQLESEQRRASMLESELGLALAASSRAEAAHASELAKVEGDVARVLAERRGLLEKLAGIEVVEDAVREMVVQMKFRVGDDESPTPEQLQAEKEALRDENILTVLGSLKATLKTLWNFKVEAEEDMRCSRQGRQHQHQQQVLALKARVREMEAQVRQAQQREEEARALAAEEAASRSALLSESREVLSCMEAQQREVLGALKGATEEAAAARRALAAAQEEGRRRDGLVLRNQQLESARHFDRVAQDRELRLMQMAHNRQLGSMQGELGRISDLLLQNDQLRERLRAAMEGREQMAGKMRTAQATADLATRQQRSQVRYYGDLAASISLSHSPSSRQRPASAMGAAALSPSGAPGSAGPRPGLAAAMAVMASRRAKAEESAKAAAEVLESQDPLYQTLANVNKMHRGIKSQIRDIKRDIEQSVPSWAKPRAGGTGTGTGAGGPQGAGGSQGRAMSISARTTTGAAVGIGVGA